MESSRRQDNSHRPLTSPYVRFRIWRFLSSFTFVLYACSLLATQPPLVDSVHYLRLRPSCEVSGQTISMSNWSPHCLATITMASAGFCIFIPLPHGNSNLTGNKQTFPGNTCFFSTYACRIYVRVFRIEFGL